MNTKFLTGIAVAVVFLLGILAFKNTNVTVNNQVPDFTAGSAVGPESTNDYQCYNNVCEYFRRQSFRTATTSVCAIQSPSATTTLVMANANFTSLPGYATLWAMGWDTTAFSTTTPLGTSNFGVVASGINILVATTSTDIRGRSGLVPPNTYINLRISTSTSTGTSSGFAPGGYCQVIFRGV